MLSCDRPGALPARRSATSTAGSAGSTARSILNARPADDGHGVRERDRREVDARRPRISRGSDDARARTAAPVRRTCGAGATAGGTCGSCYLQPALAVPHPRAPWPSSLGLLGTLFLAFGPIVFGDIGFDLSSQCTSPRSRWSATRRCCSRVLTKIYAQHEGFPSRASPELRPAREAHQPGERRARRPRSSSSSASPSRSRSSSRWAASGSARSRRRRTPCARRARRAPHDARSPDDHGGHVPRRAQVGLNDRVMTADRGDDGLGCARHPQRRAIPRARSSRASSEQTRPVDEIVLSDDASGRRHGRARRSVLLAEHRATGAATPALVVLRNPARARRRRGTSGRRSSRHPATSSRCPTKTTSGIPIASRVALAAFAARPGVDLVAADARLVDAAARRSARSLFETLGIDARRRRAPRIGCRLRGVAEAQRASPGPRRWSRAGSCNVRRRSRRPGCTTSGSPSSRRSAGGIAVMPDAVIDYRPARRQPDRRVQARSRAAGSHACESRAPSATPGCSRGRRSSRSGCPSSRGGDARVEAEAAAKLAHELMRQGHPGRSPAAHRAGLARVAYRRATRRYGLGAQDVLRDLVQPV